MLQNTPRGDGLGLPSVDNCSLGISAAELQALRETILGLLAKFPSERDSFIKAEAGVPADCTRQKAIFYMRSLVVARNRG